MKTQQGKNIRAAMAWLLLLLMLISPLMAQAHTWIRQAEPVMAGDMPCHQTARPVAADSLCPHCDENGVSLQCDCCDQAVSPSLPVVRSVTLGPVFRSVERFVFSTLTRTDPPPKSRYRPPIHS